MKVLIACEESQVVCSAFRKRGFKAYSCDIVPCSGGHEEWHIMSDCLAIINGNTDFVTMDGTKHEIPGQWDLIIAHPPCTFLTTTANAWYDVEKYGERAIVRKEDRKKAIDFFLLIASAKCKHKAIENPVGIMSTEYKKPSQYITPYMFGDPVSKKTGLWLYNLPKLKTTKRVIPDYYITKSGKKLDRWFYVECAKITDLKERSKMRSKTFPGIANAMAQQWGDYIMKGE